MREENLTWGNLTFRQDEDNLRFDINIDVRLCSPDEIEAIVSRLDLAVQTAVLAASGIAASVVVEGLSYPDSPTTRQPEGRFCVS